MHIHRRSTTEDEGIPLTPLIDCVFLLLIFFLTATSFQRKERDIRVNPPKASEAKAEGEREREIVINIRGEEEGGFYIVNGHIRSLDEIRQLLADAVKANPDQVVLIRGDRRAYHEKVVAVLDACIKVKIIHYSIATTFQKAAE
jgi:biopolymer transport protein ExbD